MIEVLQDWNPWWKEDEEYVPVELLGRKRDLVEEIIPYLRLNRIITLVGIRRAGKSTIMYQLISYLLQNSLSTPKEILFMNFDDIRFSARSISDWYQLYLEEMKPTSKPNLFLDEIHNCDNWVSFIRSLSDRKKGNIFLTDSSSFLLPNELATLITGRKVMFDVYPLSFTEFLSFKSISTKVFGTEESSIIRGHLRTYMKQGGFPELVNYDWHVSKRLLIELFNDIISKDVVSRYNVNSKKIRDLAFFLLTNSAQKTSFRRLQNTFNLGSNVPQKYINHLEDVFLCFSLHAYSSKVKELIKSAKKIYAIDTGLVNAVSFKLSENHGPLLENLVFIELKRRKAEFYYKNLHNPKSEIDFVIKQDSEVQTIINVAYEIKDEKTRNREINGLKKGISDLQPNSCLLLTWNTEDIIKVTGKINIIILPIWKWLLQNDKAEKKKEKS